MKMSTKMRRRQMKLKEAFWDEIEEQYGSVIAPQSDKLDIPSNEDSKSDEPFYGDNEPAF